MSSLMSSPVFGAAFFLLMGLGVIWVGWYFPHLSRSAPANDDARPPLNSPRGRQVWRILFTLAGLGFIGFGLTVLRYSDGHYVSVPATAPLIDQVIFALSIVCMLGSFWTGVVWVLDYTAKQKSQGRS